MQEQLIPTLHIKTIDGKTITLQNDIFPSDSVGTLKYRVYEYSGLAPYL